MASYFRHLHDVFLEADIKITEDNIKAIDWVIHEIAGIQYNNDFETWQKIKRGTGERRLVIVQDTIDC